MMLFIKFEKRIASSATMLPPISIEA